MKPPGIGLSLYAGTAQQELQQIAQSAMLEVRRPGQYEKAGEQARVTPTSPAVSMIFRDYNLNPVIDALPR